ncbi:TetR family transcriptional regulator [Mumia sp. zg.B53]|uniref:TetR/AcrR family transcriptional regulator n=1 Tax=unclassified Mumia TaxID=2621872 RepID=UPI001C6DE6D4|nr:MULTISPECIES: TetR/AcrR family transcriptional regulator [unclassified Mumia]MBW9206352.1 TetR family transcriptional regulator [Mumia sp. zg.B17]MBW9215933.1 TetR family transcriptional regulator [Mumia sp. zg.B53]MDD9350046.1 TetR/AcrR family transcriptional regulator [Mumia sp.]
MPRPDARHHLLDAAERLFAEQGVHTVSDRQVAEAAGNSNHSAVHYYFGGRTGLLQTLLDRHRAAVEPAQQRLYAQSDSLLGDIRALVIPLVDSLADLPTPSWRARFLDQAVHDPEIRALARGGAGIFSSTPQIVGSVADRLAYLDRSIVEARARLVAHAVSTACAEIEERAARSSEPARWTEAGTFLCDAIAGMLQAPITEP